MKKVGWIGFLVSLCAACHAELELPAWVSDHMMLPAGRPFPIGGTAEPGVAVTIRFAGQTGRAKADRFGEWSVSLDAIEASLEPQTLIITSSKTKNEKIIEDVLVGDIWLCAGQSNMRRRIKDSAEADESREVIEQVNIRYFNGDQWVVVSPENVENVSAVGTWFAMEMAQRKQAPVGIFVAARGGTGIEAWVPVEAFPDTDAGNRFKPLVNNLEVLKAAEEDAADFKPWGQHRLFKWGLGRAVPSGLYEQLIRSFSDLPVCGVVWYQGESNADHLEQAMEYRAWLTNLISSYRSLWKSPELPFVVIQLPDYDPGSPDGRMGWKTVQDAQVSIVAGTPNAVLVDIKDLGDLNDIHPRRKKMVGVRAAEAACRLLQK